MDRFFDQEHPTVSLEVAIPDRDLEGLRALHRRFQEAVKAHPSNYVAGIASLTEGYSVQIYGRKGGPGVLPKEAAPLFESMLLDLAGT
jgi:hypothetical protein